VSNEKIPVRAGPVGRDSLADRVLVLPREKAAGPRLIDVDIPRPRDRSDTGFVAMRRRLMAEFGLH